MDVHVAYAKKEGALDFFALALHIVFSVWSHEEEKEGWVVLLNVVLVDKIRNWADIEFMKNMHENWLSQQGSSYSTIWHCL